MRTSVPPGLFVAFALAVSACQQPPPEGPLWLNTALNARPDCPAMAWRISVMDIEQTVGLRGTVWFVDGSGTSVARGAATTAGRFDLNVTPTSGNGPSGRVTGFRFPDGSTAIRMTGTGCSNVDVRVPAGATETQAPPAT